MRLRCGPSGASISTVDGTVTGTKRSASACGTSRASAAGYQIITGANGGQVLRPKRTADPSSPLLSFFVLITVFNHT